MKSLRFYLAMIVSKIALFGLRALGRKGTSLPGSIAVKICKDFLGQITPPKTVIAVTGTNGKTTTSNLITSILRECGYKVTNNSFGTNIQAGIVAALLTDSKLNGKPTTDIAVLEVDERSSLLIYPYLAPDFLICNNLMRDSIKRNAHTEFIRYIIDTALPKTTKLILNADDMISSGLAPQNEDRTYFGLNIEIPETNADDRTVKDIVYCPDCGGRLVADYLRYNHIGRMHCPDCGKHSPDPDFLVTAIDRENGTFTVSHDGREDTFNLINDNIVNVYNFCGAITLLTKLGLTYEQICKGFTDGQIVKSRYDNIEVDDRRITMLMAKGQNPIACTRCYSYVSKCEGQDKRLLIMVDDKSDNTNNSENMCWIYDCDYTPLKDESISQILFAGPRCKDHILRALIAGVPADKMRMTDNFIDIPNKLDTKDGKDFYILYDLYSVDTATGISKELSEKLRKEREA